MCVVTSVDLLLLISNLGNGIDQTTSTTPTSSWRERGGRETVDGMEEGRGKKNDRVEMKEGNSREGKCEVGVEQVCVMER